MTFKSEAIRANDGVITLNPNCGAITTSKRVIIAPEENFLEKLLFPLDTGSPLACSKGARDALRAIPNLCHSAKVTLV